MPFTGMRILLVGSGALGTTAMLTGLATRGWGSRLVKTLREAREFLAVSPSDVVLAAESLPDGRGYELADTVARNSGTLLVGVALSENYLWLPVLQRGVNVFGKCALNADLIEFEVESLLRAPGPENILEFTGNDRLGSGRPGPHRALSPRRKITAAASGNVPVAPSTKSEEARQHTLARTEKEHSPGVSRLRGTQQPSPEQLRTRTTRIAAGIHRPVRPD
jgi:hypothetical protein